MISLATTPKIVKNIVQVIALLSLGIVFFESFSSFPIRSLISLNPLFSENYYLWQTLTAFFYIPLTSLALGELLDAVFLVMLFWIASCEIFYSFGQKRYIALLLSASIASSIAAGVIFKLTGVYASLSLLPQAILALVTVWSMCPSAEHLRR